MAWLMTFHLENSDVLFWKTVLNTTESRKEKYLMFCEAGTCCRSEYHLIYPSAIAGLVIIQSVQQNFPTACLYDGVHLNF